MKDARRTALTVAHTVYEQMRGGRTGRFAQHLPLTRRQPVPLPAWVATGQGADSRTNLTRDLLRQTILKSNSRVVRRLCY